MFTVDEVIGWRHVQFLDLDAGGSVPDANKFIGFGIGQGLKEDSLQNAENNGICPYAGGKRDEGNGREHGGPAEPAQRLFELILEGFHRVSSLAPADWWAHTL